MYYFIEKFHVRDGVTCIYNILNTYIMISNLLLLGFGMQELLFIGLIILLLFGGKKIPELMKGLGKGIKSFKEGVNDIEETVNTPIDNKNKQVSQ